MVHVVDDWEKFREYAEKVQRGFYRQIKEMDDATTIRIVAGRMAYEETLENDSPTLDKMVQWLRFHDFLKVERSVQADYFLR